MIETEKQHDALEVLKSLDAAITTTKLYPPTFPQVSIAVDKAYQLAHEFIRRYEVLSFSFLGDKANLCGLPIKEKTLGKMPGEALFQQLRLLELNHVVIEKELHESIFHQLLVFFTTSPQLVVKEGGGRSFVVNLGLHDFFPEQYDFELPGGQEDSLTITLSTFIKENRVQIENIHDITSEIDGETTGGQRTITALSTLLDDPTKMADVITAAVANLLKGVTQPGDVFFPPTFQTVFKNIDRIISDQNRTPVLNASVSSFIENFNYFGLHLILLQKFPAGFGGDFFEVLVTGLKGNFHELVRLIREEKAVVSQKTGRLSEQYRVVSGGLDRVLATHIGKQFLIREKAKSQLEEGERERQAKRVRAGINAILQGDVNAIRNKEVISQIPATVESLISKGKDSAAAIIIENITSELIKGEKDYHSSLSESLSLIGESLINTEKWDWLEKLAPPLMAWVKNADQGGEILENIIVILHRLLKHLWKSNKDEKADQILKLFFAIRSGKLEKSDDIVETVSRVQDMSVERAPLASLLEQSVTENNDLVDRRLIMQGPKVARFLLNTLFDSVTAKERLKILELLRVMGAMIAPLLLEKLAEPMPWHGKRNLLKLLAETGSTKEAVAVIDYLTHEDIRVQQEAFSCICNLSEEELKSNLLESLALASGPMKKQVIKALTPVVDQEVVEKVSSLLEDWRHFSTDDRDALIIQISELLGRSPSNTGLQAITLFLDNEGKTRENIPPEVWQSAMMAKRKIKGLQRELSKKQMHQLREANIQTEMKDAEGDAIADNVKRVGFPEEEHVEALLDEGNIDRARKLLVDLIDRASKVQRFSEAEKLREWLIEIDPTALHDIIRTAEAIEKAKSEGLSNGFLQTWSKLYDNLTTEEFNVLYYSMEHQRVPEEHIVVRQGDADSMLVFVNQGRIKMFFPEKSSEVLATVVEQGEVFGSDTFFDASVWTINATTLTTADISILPLRNIHTWAMEHPALEAKLQAFTLRFDNLNKSLGDLSNNRRDYQRKRVKGFVTANIQEADGRDSGVQMKGEIHDISQGGLSFTVRISQKKNARILLGRKIQVQIASSSEKGKLLHRNGVLMAVRSLYSMKNEYSAHVHFNDPLSMQELRGVLDAGREVEA